MRILPPSLLLACLACLAAGVFPAIAATSPPALLNYQGVLRDAADKPRAGTFDMTFHFFDALTAGNEILVDAHTSPSGVVVTNGLFNVLLGGGTITDGAGAGFYTSLDGVFRDFDTVYLEVQIGGETLAPRTRIVAAPYSLNTGSLGGLAASNYLDTTIGGQIKEGALACDQGLLGYNDSGQGFGYGIWGRGLQGGGEFLDSNGSGVAYVATGDMGIEASGSYAGGYFHDTNATSAAFLGQTSYGVSGTGTTAGGYFPSLTGSSVASLGASGYALNAVGYSGLGSVAALFSDNTTGSIARLGYGAYGVHSTASTAGYFLNSGGHSVVGLASGNWGVQGTGNFCGVGCGGGGLFSDPTGGTTSYVAYSNVGIETHASGSGGSFYNTGGTGISTAIATTSNGVISNGSKNFAQNHPDDPGSIIVYTSLEGDEAGTYTRGTARLVNGEARIPLGETFKWVTNPDLGLTAHLTPVGDWADLYVASKSTQELVVRSRDPQAGNVAFDYVVFGLRVGFEGSPVVRDKERDMPIPSSGFADEMFARKPDLRRFTALARYAAARHGIPGGDAPLDLSATEALKARIHVFDSARDGAAFSAPAAPPMPEVPTLAGGAAPSGGLVSAGALAPPGAVPSTKRPAVAAALPPPPIEAGRRADDEPEAPAFPPNSSPVRIAGTVRAGDVLTVTDAPDGRAVTASLALDRGVIGIIGGTPGAAWTGQAPIVLSGVVASCNVDATIGAITVGDLLVASATPGHAMRARGSPPAGTVIAKALEALEGGTGTIRVLVLSR